MDKFKQLMRTILIYVAIALIVIFICIFVGNVISLSITRFVIGLSQLPILLMLLGILFLIYLIMAWILR